MTIQKLWRPATVLLVCALAGATADGHPQPPPGQPVSQTPEINVPTIPVELLPAPTVAHTAPRSQTVDELLDQLTNVRARKAELEREEQAVIKSLRERLHQQQERLNKLGIGVGPVPPVK